MLNNPFCYTPRQEIVSAAKALSERIDASPELRTLFSEGKMMGVMQVEDGSFLYAFSGTAKGRQTVEGFVPPIFEYEPSQIQATSEEHSQELQKWLFSNYIVLNGKGERRSVLEIFAERGLVPPGGTGDCAAPKLLQYALSHGLKPLSLGEFWYGASPEGEIRRSGSFYPACAGKCGPLLGWMLQGLEVEPNPLDSDLHWALPDPVVIFEDSYIIVADKPSGMLAVPGRTARKSLQEWLSDYCQSPVLSCHRLDMDTSGLIIFAKDASTQAAIQRQFENREVGKSYLARLSPCEGSAFRPGDKGKISLPLMLDYYDRPRQKVDFQEGKPAVTGYEILSVYPDGSLDVRLTPFTGRTHQLRVHAAHPKGLGSPIAGDRLYGGAPAPRLMLHAATLSLRHPVTSSRLHFESASFGR